MTSIVDEDDICKESDEDEDNTSRIVAFKELYNESLMTKKENGKLKTQVKLLQKQKENVNLRVSLLEEIVQEKDNHIDSLHEKLKIMKEEVKNCENSLNIPRVKENENSKKFLEA